MRIALVSNWKDRLGLFTEGRLLADLLAKLGHQSDALQFDMPLPAPDYRADLLITLETHCEHLLSAAPVRWLVPNVEWFTPDLIPAVGSSYQKILCKTREAFEVFKPLFPNLVAHTGFLVTDAYDPAVVKVNEFLHIGGNSSHRNTEAVVDAWRWKLDGKRLMRGPLLVVSRAYKPQQPLPEGVTLVSEFIPDEDLHRLQNRCFFHLYPSSAEGFGHALREGLVCGNMVMGTDKPPLNEIDVQYRVRATKGRRVGLTNAHNVDAREIAMLCRQMESDTVYENFREFVLTGNAAFEQRLIELLKDVQKPEKVAIKTRDPKAPKRVAFLGNFEPKFSTENELKWTLERMGHVVYPIQENKVKNGADIKDAAANSDLFLWVRTPDFLQISDAEMCVVLDVIRGKGIPSASYHLDRFWGIPEREALIGEIAFWKTDFVFTADGGNQSWFLSRGVNHIWMPPAVCARGCYPGDIRPEAEVLVGFVGSVDGYHVEYPERKKLIDAARNYFGGGFQVFRGVRGQDLNDVYASAKVILGDSMFAHQGSPKSDFYWSDRVPETMGRGGLLVHPAVQGLSEADLAHALCLTVPGDFDAMFEQIEFLLERPALRRDMRQAAMDITRRKHTYTNRMQDVLDVIEQYKGLLLL